MTKKEMRELEKMYNGAYSLYTRPGMLLAVRILGFDFIKDEKSGNFKLVVMDEEDE